MLNWMFEQLFGKKVEEEKVNEAPSRHVVRTADMLRWFDGQYGKVRRSLADIHLTETADQEGRHLKDFAKALDAHLFDLYQGVRSHLKTELHRFEPAAPMKRTEAMTEYHFGMRTTLDEINRLVDGLERNIETATWHRPGGGDPVDMHALLQRIFELSHPLRSHRRQPQGAEPIPENPEA